MDAINPLLVKNLSFSFGNKRILRSVHLSLEAGKVYALVGLNGSGKSTLLRLLTGILPVQEGKIYWNGVPLESLLPGQLAQNVAVVWTGRPMENLRVSDVLATGIPSGLSKEQAYGRMWRFIAEWKMDSWLNRQIGQLSDGEARVVMIVRALLQDTPVIVLDEPATHLDLVRKAEIFLLLRKLAHEGKTILFSTHDLQLIPDFTHSIMVLHQGHIHTFLPSNANEAFAQIFRHKALKFDKQCKGFRFHFP